MKNYFHIDTPLVALFFLPLLFYPLVASSGWTSSSDVHALLELSSSLVAVTAGEGTGSVPPMQHGLGFGDRRLGGRRPELGERGQCTPVPVTVTRILSPMTAGQPFTLT